MKELPSFNLVMSPVARVALCTCSWADGDNGECSDNRSGPGSRICEPLSRINVLSVTSTVTRASLGLRMSPESSEVQLRGTRQSDPSTVMGNKHCALSSPGPMSEHECIF